MANYSDNFSGSDSGKAFPSFYNHNDLSHHGGIQGHSILQMNEIDHRFYGRDFHNESFNRRRDFYADLAATKAAYSLSGCHSQFVNSIANSANVYGMGTAASNVYNMGGAANNMYGMSPFGFEGRYPNYSNMSSGNTHSRGLVGGNNDAHDLDTENSVGEFNGHHEEEKNDNFNEGEFLHNIGTPYKNLFSCYVNDQMRSALNEMYEEEEDVKHPVTEENPNVCADNQIAVGKLFFCKLCGKNIPVVESLEKSIGAHAKLYHGSIYFCLYCDKSYKWKKSLDKHLAKFHPHAMPFSCDQCGKEFRNNYSLSDHKNLHCNMEVSLRENGHQEKSNLPNDYQEKCNTCPLCSNDFLTKDSLRKHIKSIHLTEPVHECDTCEKECKEELDTDKGSDIDKSSENRDSPLVCDICKRYYCTPNRLKQHKQTVHNIGKPQCSECGKYFASPDILKRHMWIHSDEVRYLCDVCGKTFVRLDRFNKHLNRHMGERPFECVTCKKTFRDKYVLNLHSRRHTGEKPFLCNICGKKFSSKGILRIHIARHTGDSQYKCEICNKTFAYSTYRKVHMRIHTNEKPFKCSVCSKEFTQKCSLNFHMLRHSGEKKHECSICKKSFVHRNYLNIHMRTHTGEKPFKCSSCNKGFAQRSTLNTHKQKCTGT